MKAKYQTYKFNNASSHHLDDFANQQAAIDSAKALHHPDWPCWQGIWVVRTSDDAKVFNSQRYYLKQQNS